ncbi:rho GDP-dissociation inhibitor 3-like, partial [Oncorhynchus tshawytscha]|uniref:rho GDP-dissociation inhibitor 3-like n=1 Tax=Oncorhynchus tshawytscha TaxID=74940 RepID=UPI001C3CAE9F
MLGLDVCEFGGQVLELLWLTMCYQGLMADKEEKPVGEEDDETDLNYTPPAQKSLQEIQELDKDDESLRKYKQTLLGAGPVVADLTIPNVQVTRLTLMCDQAPGPITMDLSGKYHSSIPIHPFLYHVSPLCHHPPSLSCPHYLFISPSLSCPHYLSIPPSLSF